MYAETHVHSRMTLVTQPVTAHSPASPNAEAVPQYDPAAIAKAAERSLASYRSLFAPAHHLGPINRDAYDRDVFTWYDETGASLAALGFTALGDRKVVKQAGVAEPGAGPFARRFVSRDHTHRVDIFQVKSPKDGTWTRVVNLIAETSDGFFVWTSTAAPRWNTPGHVLLEHWPGETGLVALVGAHATRVAAYLQSHDGVSTVTLASLDDVIASENRCQARTGAFRAAQGVPSVEELLRLGSEPELARLTHEAMCNLAAGRAPQAERAEAWHVTTVELPRNDRGTMSLTALIEFAVEQGLAQVEKVGSPLHPFLVEETGRAHFFVPASGDGDPMEIALQTLRGDGRHATACALVIDSRIAIGNEAKTDAIVVVASARDAAEGEIWAHRYRPRGWLRSFKRIAAREKVAASKNLFAEAAA